MLLDAASASDPPLELDYVTVADPQTFAEVGPDYTGRALLLVAARVGATRLIDNTWLTFGPSLLPPAGDAGGTGKSPPLTDGD
jgi:pantoate--beta-alanine ligase